MTNVPLPRWNLTDLFAAPGDFKFTQAKQTLQEQSATFAQRYRGMLLHLTGSEITDAIRKYEALLLQIHRLAQYAGLSLAVNVENSEVKAFEHGIREFVALIQNQLLFFELELGRFSEGKLKSCLVDEVCRPYWYFLERLAKTAHYQLQESEERIINLKNVNGAQAFENLYEELTSAFRFSFSLEGETRILNGEALRALRQHPDPAVRSQAMRLFMEKHAENHLVLGSCLNYIVKDFNQEAILRGYSSSIAVRNTQNDLPDELVDLLHTVTSASYPLVQRYYAFKKRFLGLAEFSLADIYAPLPQLAKEYDFFSAKQLVIEAFAKFDPEFRDLAEKIFAAGHLDAPVAEGKRGGAFCSAAAPGDLPYVLLNHLGRLRDVSTMAHELGHAIHYQLSSEQPLVHYHAALPLAETASVFSEMILADHLLRQQDDPHVKIALLAHKLEELFATSHRQNMFSNFERAAHERIRQGLTSAEELGRIYKEELGRMFGQSVLIPDWFQWEWSAISHFFALPFYVYAYNFANLLVLALYRMYQEQGSSFVPVLKSILRAGSGASPVDILRRAGCDVTSRQFWEKSLLVVEGYLDQIEALANHIGLQATK
jgi:oligoendopeptidase F